MTSGFQHNVTLVSRQIGIELNRAQRILKLPAVFYAEQQITLECLRFRVEEYVTLGTGRTV